uniref:Tyr recombinase domain-containing protein n=2 Tax=Trichogramma kaykai TaxID=54128 RepID=A0ABD2WJK2_9HYME
MRIELTKEKKTSIKNKVSQVQEKKNCNYEELLSLIGTLVSACPAVKYGWLYYKELERIKWKLGPIGECNNLTKVAINDKALKDLEWWEKHIQASFNNIRQFNFKREIFSDASMTGWGGVCNNKHIHGFWDDQEKNQHINFLELQAAYLVLKEFSKFDKNCQILIRIDNLVAISYINKMGGIKYDYLNEITRKIWIWCMKRNIWLFAEYVASKENPADKDSRIKNADTEWELSNEAFNQIVRKLGKPDMDLFASNENKKCSNFCSWQRDPQAYVINAFTTNWSRWFWYAFPPFSLIAKVLKKIREEQCTGIMERSPSAGQTADVDSRDLIRRAFERRGYERSTVDIMINSLSESTLKQYTSALKKWTEFCKKESIDSFCNKSINILKFLTQELQKGAKYGTLNSMRSAISLLNNNELQNSKELERFFKGVYRLRPPAPKYSDTWDVTPVLTELKKWHPLESLSLEKISWKVTMLLALGTGFRAQSIALIKLDGIKEKKEGVEIRIQDLIKTSKVGKNQPYALIPFFNENPEICIAKTLIEYIKFTANLRSNADNLLITIKKPHRAATSQTISRWLKAVLQVCKVDPKYTGHSTRHAATSKAQKNGLDINIIKKAAGWSESSSVFMRFYNRPILNINENFAANVCNNNTVNQ